MPTIPRCLCLATSLLPLAALAPHLPAQLPSGAVVILQGQPQQFSFDTYAIIDPAGGGACVLPLPTSPLLLSQTTAFATDPNDAGRLFLLDDPSSLLPGISRTTIGALGRVMGSPGGPTWTQSGGQKMVVGSTRVFTLRAPGIVEATAVTGGAPFLLLQQSQAIDIALAEPFVYIACSDPTQPAPLIEFSLQTGAQRVVGNYVDVRCVAKSRNSNALAVGLGNGTVLELDLASGNVQNSFVAGFGFLRALAYTLQDELVFVLDSGGLGFTVWNQNVVGPIYTGNDGWKSLTIATAPSASVVSYGNGCGVGAAVGWDAIGLPTLGNAQFVVQLQNAPSSLPLALWLGDSRSQSSVLAAPLPFDLQPFGAAGCELLTDPEVALLLTSDSLGNAAQTIPIPPVAALAGVEFQAQGLVLDPAVPLGLATTSAIAFRLL